MIYLFEQFKGNIASFYFENTTGGRNKQQAAEGRRAAHQNCVSLNDIREKDSASLSVLVPKRKQTFFR